MSSSTYQPSKISNYFENNIRIRTRDRCFRFVTECTAYGRFAMEIKPMLHWKRSPRSTLDWWSSSNWNYLFAKEYQKKNVASFRVDIVLDCRLSNVQSLLGLYGKLI